MGNPHRGEVSFTADDKEWTLRFSANALCELEDHLNLGTADLVAKLQDPKGARLSLVRSVFWAGLRDRQPGTTMAEAGEVITAVGFERASQLIADAMEKAFPAAPVGQSDARPPANAAAGTGRSSRQLS